MTRDANPPPWSVQDSSVAAYVEDALGSALTDLPVVWGLGEGISVQRVVWREGRWVWRRIEKPRIAWLIYCELLAPERLEGASLFYELWVSRDLEAFLLTHSNVNAGIMDAHWLIRTATYIPFSVLTEKYGVIQSQPLSLVQLLADSLLSCPPNLLWPT